MRSAMECERIADLEARAARLRSELAQAETALGEAQVAYRVVRALNAGDVERPAVVWAKPVPWRPVRKVRSTWMVAELVQGLERPLRAGQILELLESRGEVPSTWGRPRAALGNALMRALQRGWIYHDPVRATYWGQPHGQGGPGL